MEEVRTGCTASCAAETWERRIEGVAGGQDAVRFMDGSKGWRKGRSKKKISGMKSCEVNLIMTS